MKPHPIILCAALFAGATVSANLAIPHDEADSFLVREEVAVRLGEHHAEVTGSFTYHVDRVPLRTRAETSADYPLLTLYLPVYAAEDADLEEIKPRVTHREKELKLDEFWDQPNRKTTILNPNAGRFGTMPQLKGQKVFWFSVSFLPLERKETVSIRYRQKLSGGKFIYTPLIPKMKEGEDYGTITVSADRPIRLLDEDGHEFEKDGGTFLIQPAHKRAIVVEVGEVQEKRP